MKQINLGLIGDNIRESKAPDLHRECGRLSGVNVTYELFIPPAMNMGFDAVFDHCQSSSLRGVNVTLPYKERVISRVVVDDPQIKRLGAVNTVLFGSDEPRGFNTDYSGFIAAYRGEYASAAPGRVVLIGAGGVGKAIAFGLMQLGASDITVVDTDIGKAEQLAISLRHAGADKISCDVGTLQALKGADGVVNCTPLGMHGHPGSPVPEGLFPQGLWAFDAVYTPLNTPFRKQAESAGAHFLSGFELFFQQGIDAFELFTGIRPTALPELRKFLKPE